MTNESETLKEIMNTPYLTSTDKGNLWMDYIKIEEVKAKEKFLESLKCYNPDVLNAKINDEFYVAIYQQSFSKILNPFTQFIDSIAYVVTRVIVEEIYISKRNFEDIFSDKNAVYLYIYGKSPDSNDILLKDMPLFDGDNTNKKIGKQKIFKCQNEAKKWLKSKVIELFNTTFTLNTLSRTRKV